VTTIRELITSWGFNVQDAPLERVEQRLQAVMGRADAVESRLGRATSGIKSFGLGLAALVTGQALGLGALFKTIGDSEQTGVAFEVLIGSAEKARATLAELQQFALATPFNFKDVSEYAKRLLAVGFAAEELVPTMNALGNIAAGVGTDKLPHLVLAFGQVRTAGHLTGMELRQFTEAGVPLIDELAKTLGKPKAQIQQMVSAGRIGFEDVRKALMAVTGEGGRFNNLMQRQSKTMLGVFSNIVDTIQMMAKKLGDRGLRAQATSMLNGVLDFLNTNESRLLGFAERLVASSIKSITWVMRFARAVNYVVEAMGGWERALQLATLAMTAMLSVKILGFIGELVMALRGLSIAGLAAAAAPVAIGAAIVGLLLIFEDILAYFQGRKSITGLLLKEFGSFEDFARSLSETVDGLINRLFKKFDELKDKAGPAAKALAKQVTDALLNLKPEDFKAFGQLILKALDLALVGSGLVIQLGMTIGAAIIQGIEASMREKAPALARLLFGEDPTKNDKLKAIVEGRQKGLSTEEINKQLEAIDAKENSGFWGRMVHTAGAAMMSIGGIDPNKARDLANVQQQMNVLSGQGFPTVAPSIPPTGAGAGATTVVQHNQTQITAKTDASAEDIARAVSEENARMLREAHRAAGE
jgi:tape measure domain-containing protein